MKTNHTSISYLAWFAFPVLTFLMAAVPLSIFFEPVSGDLTRIGHWSERDFGWNKPQDEVFIRENRVSISNSQVLVLGDSFSNPNIWQSYLSEFSNIETLTFQYKDVGCLKNWLSWVVEKKNTNTTTVVIQIAERSFVSVFRSLNSCIKRVPKQLEIAEQTIMPVRPDYGLTLDATYLLPTLINMFLEKWDNGPITSGKVINTPLSSDKFFSNLKANRFLYYLDDDIKISWSEKDVNSSVRNIKSIQDELSKINLRLVVVVVPDKSSVYREYFSSDFGDIKYPSVFKQLQVAGVNNVNLLTFFKKSINETVDLYLPNDTHLSVQGYKLMARKISDDLF